MHTIILILTLVVLAFDSFDISLSKGASVVKNTLRENLAICSLFAIAHMTTLTIGYIGGVLVEFIFSDIAKFFGPIVLILIGIKMIHDGFELKNEKEIPTKFNTKEWGLLAGVASLDALAMGLTFRTMHIELLEPVILIGTITFLFAGSGIILGKKLNNIIGNKFIAIGGIILIILAISMLLETIF